MMDLAPDYSLVRQLKGDLNFKQYADMYHHQSENIMTKDLIFAEKVYDAEKDKDNSFHHLIALLNEQSRWIDMAALYGSRLIENPSETSYTPLIKLLDQHLDSHDSMQVLENIYRQSPHYIPLKQDLVEKYIQLNQLENVLNMVEHPDLELDARQTESIRDMLEQPDLQSRSLTAEQLQSLFKMTIDVYPKKAIDLIHGYISALLNTNEPAYIRELLRPLSDRREVHPLYQKMNRLVTFSDDLDQMQALGELYYEFRQLEQAIECFSWEMELKPEDPKPLKWLSKVYQQLGMKQESKAYRQLLTNLQKRA
jgi:tetratricopeptide (TPR) repeat protein